MKTIIKKKYFLLLAGFLLILAAIFYFGRWQAHQSIEFRLLKKIYPDKQVISQEDTGHYIIDKEDYYVKNFGDLNNDDLNDFVIMQVKILEKNEVIIPPENEIQIQTVGNKNFSFYSADINASKIIPLIENVPNLVWSLEDAENKKIDITLKDITGDDIPEIFVPFVASANNITAYSILTFNTFSREDPIGLIKMHRHAYFEDNQNEVIDFDSIEKEGDLVVMFWRDIDIRGKYYYSVYENELAFERGSVIEGKRENDAWAYEYREIDQNGNIIIREKRNALWTNEFSRNIYEVLFAEKQAILNITEIANGNKLISVFRITAIEESEDTIYCGVLIKRENDKVFAQAIIGEFRIYLTDAEYNVLDQYDLSKPTLLLSKSLQGSEKIIKDINDEKAFTFYQPWDIDGDGKKEEFVVQKYQSCNGNSWSFIKYNNKTNRLEKIKFLYKIGNEEYNIFVDVSGNFKAENGIITYTFYDNLPGKFYESVYRFNKQNNRFEWVSTIEKN